MAGLVLTTEDDWVVVLLGLKFGRVRNLTWLLLLLLIWISLSLLKGASVVVVVRLGVTGTRIRFR